jgi:hypothetical protein
MFPGGIAKTATGWEFVYMRDAEGQVGPREQVLVSADSFWTASRRWCAFHSDGGIHLTTKPTGGSWSTPLTPLAPDGPGNLHQEVTLVKASGHAFACYVQRDGMSDLYDETVMCTELLTPTQFESGVPVGNPTGSGLDGDQKRSVIACVSDTKWRCVFNSSAPNEGNRVIRSVTSNDACEAWGVPITIAEMSGYDLYNPFLLVRSNGNLLVAFTAYDGNGHKLYKIRSTDGGSNWATPVQISLPDGVTGCPRVVLAEEANGDVYAFTSWDTLTTIGTFKI